MRSRPIDREHRHAASATFQAIINIRIRLEEEAINLRKQADGMPHNIRRDELLRTARQIDVAAQVNKWLTSPGLRVPT